jgi:alpha-maltose-1-phosphate synthase
MKVLMISREYPPNIYGGAGVHVEHLAREIARILPVEVRCFGGQREEGAQGTPSVRGFEAAPDLLAALDPRLRKSVDPLAVNVAMTGVPVDADIVHCHTWYSLMAGLWAKILHGIPFVITTHSLEPLRPWKAEQLGRGYDLSSWIERTAYEAADRIIAVSEKTRKEVLDCYPVDPAHVRVVHNGIDLERFRKVDPVPVLEEYGIDPAEPYVLFVGRITRQKGIIHLIRALRRVRSRAPVVLLAGAPDTPEIGREMEAAVRDLQSVRPGVRWIPEMVPVPKLAAFYSGAALFVCPSVYEPFGIINLEAAACEVPVVASKVGGIPEAVADGETGVLVPIEQNPPPDFEPRDPDRFARDLAAAIDRLLEDTATRKRLGRAGRERVERQFSWASIARRTVSVYQELVPSGSPVRS